MGVFSIIINTISCFRFGYNIIILSIAIIVVINGSFGRKIIILLQLLLQRMQLLGLKTDRFPMVIKIILTRPNRLKYATFIGQKIPMAVMVLFFF